MPTPIQAYTTKDVAELFKIKPRTVRDYIGAGLIKAVPWVGKSWLIQPKEIDRLRKAGIDTNGLHAKLNAKRGRKDLAVCKEARSPSVKRELSEGVFERYQEQARHDAEVGAGAPKALPRGVSAISALAAETAREKTEAPIRPRLSVEDTRFGTRPKQSKPACLNIAEKPPVAEGAVYHGKTLTPDETRFIKWLQRWAENSRGAGNGRVISGTGDEWHHRCKGMLGVPEIKNVLMFLRAKKFLVCDGCNTVYQVRNLDEFFTCAPVEGSALPKSYKYV
jgi:hypothetical protein